MLTLNYLFVTVQIALLSVSSGCSCNSVDLSVCRYWCMFHLAGASTKKDHLFYNARAQSALRYRDIDTRFNVFTMIISITEQLILREELNDKKNK